jgi:hypothetical protein
MQQEQLIEIYDHAESVAMFSLHDYNGSDYAEFLLEETQRLFNEFIAIPEPVKIVT